VRSRHPVIASDIPVNIKQKASGSFFFRWGDTEDRARAIQERLERPEMRRHPDGQRVQRVRDFAPRFVEIAIYSVFQS